MSMIIFALLLVAGTGFFIWNVRLIRQNILLGTDLDRSGNKVERFKVMALIALGQKKMFKRPIPALLHLAIYASFCITQIELIEIFVDGLIGSHRIFRPALGGFYTFMISLIEVLSLLTFIATIAFLWRRNILKVPRLNMKELAGWAKLDANLILIFEIILLTCIFMMNGADEATLKLKSNESYGFAVSQFVGPLFFGRINSIETLHIIERIGWWGHIIMVFTFLNYLPYSKHFHIVLAFPNTFYSNLWAKGRFNNLASVTKEVQLMLDPNADPYAMPAEGEEVAPPRFGARDVNDLTWKQLLDAYTCTECGRCTSVCPANVTGKLLSPRKVMMDTRDRLTEYGGNMRKNGKDYDDGKSLHSYISEEELWACTSCNACVDICPVNIDPLSIIVDLRRYLVMEESKAPTELTTMMTNIENNGAPWQFSPADRLNWKDE